MSDEPWKFFSCTANWLWLRWILPQENKILHSFFVECWETLFNALSVYDCHGVFADRTLDKYWIFSRLLESGTIFVTCYFDLHKPLACQNKENIVKAQNYFAKFGKILEHKFEQTKKSWSKVVHNANFSI